MSGIMYKNRPYAGGGGAGGASALSDLTDTSISNPANGQVLKYNNGFWENDDESGGTTVVANPQGTASADLEKLQVGNNIYNIPQGTEVVANPTGTPTEELSTIRIGQDIYEIVGGGGTSQIIDVSNFTKVYDTLNSYGSSGTKVNTALDTTNEVVMAIRMNGGWNASGSCYYDAENKIGAYGGYEFDKPLSIDFVRFYLGRYSGQNKTLYVTAQYLNANSEWIDVEDMNIANNISYPINYFDVSYKSLGKIYGVRWIHKKEPLKSSNNNIVFFGMVLFEFASSSGGNFEITDLWGNTTGGGNGTYTLSQSIDDFDAISIWFGIYSEYVGNPYISDHRIINVSELQEAHNAGIKFILTGYASCVVYADFDGTTMTLSSQSGSQTVLQVKGIKY